MKKYFLGIDIGTFESKGVLVDDNFEVVATHATPHGMENPKPNHFEHDAEEVWWKDYCIISNALIQKTGIDPKQIACVGASTLGCDCVAVDEECHPLRKAILYGIDARAEKEIEYLNEYYGEEKIQEMFGHPLCSDDVALKILWIKNNEPEVYAKTYKFLTGSSFMVAKLTGEYKIDHFLGKSSFIPIYNADGTVNEKECALFCRPDQVAQCALVTDIAGYVTAKAAKETGLAEGTPVIVGTGDSTAESISGGLVEPGNVLFQFGSSLFFYYCMDHMVEDPKLHISLFTVPNTFCIGGGTNAAGTLTRWVRDNFYFDALEAEKHGGPNAYGVMAQDAAQVPAGSDGLIMLPYLYGERSPIHDPKAKGVLFGLTGKHTRAHINRAALEAVGYTVYQHVKLFQGKGLPVNSIIVAGGGTKNQAWMQAVADITGVPVELTRDFQSASYGDAMMAAIGCGALKDFAALKKAIPKNTIIAPNMENHKRYAPLAELYDELYQNNKALMHRLDEVTNG